MTSKPLVKITRAAPKASRSLARRGESNVLWLIVSVIGVVIGLVVLFIVAHGVIPSLGSSNALTVSTEELGGILVINIKAMGVSGVRVEAVNLLPSGSGASSCTAYLDGNSYSGITSLPASGLSITLYPGDTLSITCSSLSGSPTQVEVVTTSGAYTAPIS
jgi:hypothetical protein